MSELGYFEWDRSKFGDTITLDDGREFRRGWDIVDWKDIWFEVNGKCPVDTGKFHGPEREKYISAVYDYGSDFRFKIDHEYPVDTGKFHGPLQLHPTECSRDRLEQLVGFKLLDFQWEWLTTRNSRQGNKPPECKHPVVYPDHSRSTPPVLEAALRCIYCKYELDNVDGYDWDEDSSVWRFEGYIKGSEPYVSYVDEYGRWLEATRDN